MNKSYHYLSTPTNKKNAFCFVQGEVVGNAVIADRLACGQIRESLWECRG